MFHYIYIYIYIVKHILHIFLPECNCCKVEKENNTDILKYILGLFFFLLPKIFVWVE